MPTATINGLELHYERHGDAGEPLVLVHGYTGDITDWRHQIAEFAPTHRVLALDHRGHGRSEAPRDRAVYTITNMADDVEALAVHAGFERYHLVGHSMGGCVAQEIVLRSPGRLMSLTLHDSGHQPPSGRPDDVASKVMAHSHRVAEAEGMGAVAELHAKWPAHPNVPAERREEQKARLARMSVDGFVGAWGALATWEGTANRARGIAVSTLVICGEHDPLMASAKFFAAEIPGAVLAVIAGAAHAPQQEYPEAFNLALRGHLSRNTGVGAK
ncbi:MAG: alpha/beta hydrolase [Dehalococcoidia bacterium]